MTHKMLKYQHFSSESCRVLANFIQFCKIFAESKTCFPPMYSGWVSELVDILEGGMTCCLPGGWEGELVGSLTCGLPGVRLTCQWSGGWDNLQSTWWEG